MAGHLKIERYYWFDHQIRRGRYPNASTLADKFEISVKTARRDIDFMQDRLGAPLEYDPSRKGFFYSSPHFTLSGIQATQEELLAILLARHLLSQSAGGVISEAISSFGRKLFTAMGEMGLPEARLAETFSATWNGYSPAQSVTFRTVADALLHERLLHFLYRSPRSDEATVRLAEPHHLQHYMGSWVLVAFCRTRGDWRKFYLSRMSAPAPGDPFRPRPRAEWAHHLEGAFGIFQGEEHVRVVLRFTPFRARWIREQLWHPGQALRELSDGALELSFPVADLREIKLRVLQFGADVEVIEPAGLREEVRAEIARMGALYRMGEK